MSQGCRFLQQLVQDMNAQLTTFTSLEHYEAELAGSITPMIADKFEALDEGSADLLQVRAWFCLAMCTKFTRSGGKAQKSPCPLRDDIWHRFARNAGSARTIPWSTIGTLCFLPCVGHPAIFHS